MRSNRPTLTPRRRQQCACGCGRKSDALFQLSPTEAYALPCASRMVIAFADLWPMGGTVAS